MAKNVAKEFKYSALAYSPRTGTGSPSFVLFHAPAAEILDWAAVDRLEPDNVTGAQRPLKKLKVSKVVRFFDDERNTVPTAIVVSLDEKNVTFQGVQDDRGSGRHVAIPATLRCSTRSASRSCLLSYHISLGMTKVGKKRFVIRLELERLSKP
jgi:hypothetical protein